MFSELQYVLGNVLRSQRYGAMSSRLGRVQNTLAAIVFSDTEIFSNLGLTQQVYDSLMDEQYQNDKTELPFPLATEDVREHVEKAIDKLIARVVGRTPLILKGDVLQRIQDETINFYRTEDNVKALLAEVSQGYQSSQEHK